MAGRIGWVRLVAGWSVLWACATAMGQFRPGGWGGGFDPGVSSSEIDRYAEILSLTQEQREVVDALFEAYMAEFQQAADHARDIVDEAREEFRDTRDPSVWQDIQQEMTAFQEQRTSLENGFLDDLRLVLDETQARAWPVLERTRRRERTLRRSFISGEGVDLVRMVGDLKIDEAQRAEVQPLVARYEAELDRALIKRNEIYEEGMSRGLDLWRSGDWDKMEEAFDKARAAGLQVRDINRRFARQIEAALDEQSRAAFEQDFLRESFPAVYRRVYADKVIEAVGAFDDLDDSQREQLDQIATRYRAERASTDKRWMEEIEHADETRTIRDMMGRWGRRGGDDAEGSTRRQRRQLDRDTVQKIRDLLTEEQRARLPERGEDEEAAGRNRGRRGGFGRGGGRGGARGGGRA